MNIFEALRQSHEVQRKLSRALVRTKGRSPRRTDLFRQLKDELSSHALSEERHFYAPLMAADSGADLSRHAIAEHHEIDEIVEDMEKTDMSSSAWLPLAKKLSEKVRHHLKEEERGFFQMAGKILSEKQKIALAKSYLLDYEKALQN